MPSKYKYIYGPVSSWRLGSSLGIDPISQDKKICTFDCVYCQIGRTKIFSEKREIFVPTEEIVKEIKSLPPLKIDYITFSGSGEPTLARNLGELIREIKKIRKEKTAVITNSSLIDRKDVREDLKQADLVMAKIDASREEVFLKVNRPLKDVNFDRVLNGIKTFRRDYGGRFVLQAMFIAQNKKCAPGIAKLAQEIGPDEVQINTPLRPCASKPLSMEDINAIKEHFKNMDVISVYDVEKKKVDYMDRHDTSKRRGSHDQG